ncbi:uncharacterized protein LOC111698590 [Eurytemora carolleeae]|uniref:uncharacterized protein LOC111698590 n=1 Tax=Eurytemora carolleeae TaxID=1294199 RepID=UPI000C7580C6|nr:uncharacterized protein LOC111698590 [Eurytemora carolleeae]|eukprot:XP_023324724.1 uncharacterized protein LOC111698590 [Eurytemora affinis]
MGVVSSVSRSRECSFRQGKDEKIFENGNKRSLSNNEKKGGKREGGGGGGRRGGGKRDEWVDKSIHCGMTHRVDTFFPSSRLPRGSQFTSAYSDFNKEKSEGNLTVISEVTCRDSEPNQYSSQQLECTNHYEGNPVLYLSNNPRFEEYSGGPVAPFICSPSTNRRTLQNPTSLADLRCIDSAEFSVLIPANPLGGGIPPWQKTNISSSLSDDEKVVSIYYTEPQNNKNSRERERIKNSLSCI